MGAGINDRKEIQRKYKQGTRGQLSSSTRLYLLQKGREKALENFPHKMDSRNELVRPDVFKHYLIGFSYALEFS